MRRLLIALSLLVTLGAAPSAQAHWVKTPWQISQLHSANQKVQAYEQNISHANAAIRWAKSHRSFFAASDRNKFMRGHLYVIRFSTSKVDGLQWLSLPPHYSGWICIHGYEGSWKDAGDPYWGGLQMDRGFMRTYAPSWLLKKGWANMWTPLQQMWVAERAFSSGRGYYPWPNTARYCGLL